MKNLNLLRYTLSFVLVLMTLHTSVFAGKEPKKTKSLLWKIEGEGIRTSYIYGTLHVLKQEDFFLKESLQKSFPLTEQLVLEIDLDDPSMMPVFSKLVQMKDGVTLEALLGNEDYEKLDNYLKSTHGVGAEAFHNWMPYMLSSAMYAKVVGTAPASYEQKFVQMATERKMEILGLETVEQQLALFHDFPYEKQAGVLKTYLNKEEVLQQEFAEMTNLYKNEHIVGLERFAYGMLDAIEMNPEVFLYQRNRDWIEGIKAYAQEKPTFFAVGAAHLAGEEGVLALLRESGLTVTPVE